MTKDNAENMPVIRDKDLADRYSANIDAPVRRCLRP
jgi:hypothetical protein